MPAELSILYRYKCDFDGCHEHFGFNSHREEHHRSAHVVRDELSIVTSEATCSTEPHNYREASRPALTVLVPKMAPKEDKNVKCTYANCKEKFQTKQDMILHKMQDSKHDYCSTCPAKDEDGNQLYDSNGQKLYGVDCKDWNDFMKHKVESSKHISCPMCGVDFKSQAGLRGHVQQMHPIDQKITCPGCETVFVKASAIVQHLERGECRNKKDPKKRITKEEFHDQLHRKAIIKGVMKHYDPETAFSGAGTYASSTMASSYGVPSTASNATLLTATRKQGPLSTSGQTDLTAGEEGGVLLDAPIVGNASLRAPLQPSINVPRRDARSIIGRDRRQSDLSSLASSALRGPPSVISEASTIRTKPSTSPKASVNSTSNTPAAASFPDAETNDRTTPVNGPNLFSQKFWDPDKAGFSAETFFNAVISRYICPFPHCDHTTDEPMKLSDHLRTDHSMKEFRCPSCRKEFKFASALISHCESPTHGCNIRNKPEFYEVIDQYSGGFLSVKREKTYRDYAFGNSVPEDEEEEEVEWSTDKRKELVATLRGHQTKFQAERPVGFWEDDDDGDDA